MWRLLAVLLSLVILALATQIGTPRHAYACSVGPDFNPVEASDAVVEGRFLGWEIVDDPGTMFLTVRVEMTVERVHSGEVAGAEVVTIIDSRSLIARDEELIWAGSGGSCGAFNADPTGKYAIMALSLDDDGLYRTGLPLVSFIGDGPDGDEYERTLERMASFADAAELPPLGSGSDPSGGGREVDIFVAAGAAILGIALLGTSAAVRVRGRRR